MLDVQTKRVGFRSVELLQEPILEPDQYGTGTTFLFAVNGVKMFMGGAHLTSPKRRLRLMTVLEQAQTGFRPTTS